MDLFDKENRIDLFFGPDYENTYRKVLEISFQVLINCEHQINKYQQPCGSLLADIANYVKAEIRDKSIKELSPCTLLYCVAIKLFNYKHQVQDSLRSGLALFLICLADNLLDSEKLDFQNFVTCLVKSQAYLERIGWKDKMFTSGINPFIEALKETQTGGSDMKHCLQAGANAAEEAALQTSSTNKVESGDAGAHAVGVFTRALYQAINITL